MRSTISPYFHTSYIYSFLKCGALNITSFRLNVAYKMRDARERTSGVIAPFMNTPKNRPDLYSADLLVEKAVMDYIGREIETDHSLLENET